MRWFPGRVIALKLIKICKQQKGCTSLRCPVESGRSSCPLRGHFAPVLEVERGGKNGGLLKARVSFL